MTSPVLVIGNKNYSSWSLRAWLALRKSGVVFEERLLPLDTAAFEDQIADYSPTRKVPVLWDEALCVCDSLAIAEYANERWADGALWPEGMALRAQARSLSAEMHSGFPCLRARLPMNCRAGEREVAIDAELELEINRIVSIWHDCRESAGDSGPWLYGTFSIADAMFAPVALRFATYGIKLPAFAHSYQQTVLQDHDVAQWIDAAREEVEVVDADEAGV
jgi:glutathione S-transferase